MSLTKMKEFTLAIRIPGWARDQPVPSELYYYLNNNIIEITIKINGKLIDFKEEKGFVNIKRIWESGDTIDLNISMPIRRVLCNENVEENIGKVALEKGPIVYCAESVDNKVDSIFELKLNDNDNLKVEYRKDILGGVNIVSNKYLILPSTRCSY